MTRLESRASIWQSARRRKNTVSPVENGCILGEELGPSYVAASEIWDVAKMDLQQNLNDELKTAMRAGDEVRRDAISMLRAALKNEEIELRHPLSEEESHRVVTRIAKRHRESIDQFTKGNRPDLVERESAQLAVVERFLPTMMSREQVEAEVRAALAGVDTSGPRGQGAAMAAVAPRLRGKADMKVVSEVVREMLAADGGAKS